MINLVTTVAIALWLPRLPSLPIILLCIWLRQYVTSVPFSGRFLISQKLSFCTATLQCNPSMIIIIIITLINVSFVTIMLQVS